MKIGTRRRKKFRHLSEVLNKMNKYIKPINISIRLKII